MKRQLRKSVRSTDRVIQQQRSSLNQLKQQITRAAKSKKGLDATNKTKLKIMGKEYLKLNKRLENTELYKTTLESVALKFEQQISMKTMTKSMQQSTGVLNELHKFGNLAYLRNNVMELEKGMFQLGIKEEMLDDIMLEEEDEEEDEEEEYSINKLLESIVPEVKEQKSKVSSADEEEKVADMLRMQEQVSKGKSKNHAEEPVPEEQIDDEVDNMINQMKDKLKALQT